MNSSRPESRDENQASSSQPPHNDGAADNDIARRSSADETPARTSNVPSSEEQHKPTERADPYVEQVQTVITSDIGITVLLGRLKQSIQSAREFATFLQKRARLEEDHANGLRKISRATHDNLRRPEHRQGSFIASYDEITRTHERMAENGSAFATSLHQMYEDMLELTNNLESGRKHWKHTGLAAEQRLMDAEAAMRKSKSKYDALAEDYDRARTGGAPAAKKFGLKGPKSAAQYEEDMLHKVQLADQDYAAKVQVAQSTRNEHISKHRPEAVKTLQDMIKECDSALTMQMQRFAAFCEKLLLENGMSVSPLKGATPDLSKGRSMREAIADINNDGDLSYYIASHTSQIAPRAEIKYERNPVLAPAAPPPSRIPPQRQSEPPQNMGSMNQRPGFPNTGTPSTQSPMGPGPSFSQAPPPAISQQPQFQQHERSYSQGPHNVPPQPYGNQPPMGGPGPGHSPSYTPTGSFGSGGPPQLGSLPFQTSAPLSQGFQPSGPPPPHQDQYQPPNQIQQQRGQYDGPPQPYGQRPSDASNLPPLKPVFGLTLEHLFERDGSAVPMVVYQCIQAVDLFGLEVEGIYRLSGTGSHVNKIRAMFDNDASKLDFRNPEAFFHDVNSVAGLLKQFFRDLPDPLLTTEHYSAFIEASKADDDTIRRDSLHAIINSLPDPNYATLRAITLHLHRVVENASINRMNASNLAIVWGPTLMGAGAGGKIQDAGWQVKVVQTILDNCYQIFDDD